MRHVRILLKRDTSFRWKKSNPILVRKEVGFDLTKKKFKVGDGKTPWNKLPYTTKLGYELRMPWDGAPGFFERVFGRLVK